VAPAEPGIAIVGGAGAFVTDALTWMLTNSGSRVLGSYRDFSTLETALRGHAQALHVAVVDAEDPAAGPPAVAALRQAYPDLKIVLLCEVVSPALVGCAIEEHVDGVVLKSDAPDEMILALRHVFEGRAVMPVGWHEASRERETVVRMLSVREREVLDLAASGLSNKEIAERLVISTNTVKFHLRGIYCSLGVHNRVQASQATSQDHAGRTELDELHDSAQG
jgi:two-component system, NarL family, nitrate/nitrite response regulator NarL